MIQTSVSVVISVRLVCKHFSDEGQRQEGRHQEDDHRLLVTHYEGGCAGGQALEDEEWQGLLGAEEALVLSQPAAAFPGAALWLIRPHLRHRDARLRALFTGARPFAAAPGTSSWRS